MPLSLSDDELAAVMNLSAPLPPANRNRFLEAIAAELQVRGGCSGPGRGASRRPRASTEFSLCDARYPTRRAARTRLRVEIACCFFVDRRFR
jgi:hypothetical protein